MTRVASIGECMIELKQAGGGLYSRGFGGDTLNTAIYLARLGIGVDYITALGDDPYSDEMIEGWRAEGVGTDRVARLKGKLPGLYMIETDGRGERRFLHWRDSAAARMLLDQPDTENLLRSMSSYALVYFSAITLSIYTEGGRARLLAALRTARAHGTRVVFDTNFRARGWPDPAIARRAFAAAFESADIVLASAEDLEPLHPGDGPDRLLAGISCGETVLKLGAAGSMVRFEGAAHRIELQPMTAQVVDTTAAGDSFAAAYLAARLAGIGPVEAARAGHRLAGVVVCHPGAIIPRSAMPADPIPLRKASS